jgi:hypothetical protein
MLSRISIRTRSGVSRGHPTSFGGEGVRNVLRHHRPGRSYVYDRHADSIYDLVPADDPLRRLQIAPARRICLVPERDACSKDPAGDALGIFCAAPSQVQVVGPGVDRSGARIPRPRALPGRVTQCVTSADKRRPRFSRFRRHAQPLDI